MALNIIQLYESYQEGRDSMPNEVYQSIISSGFGGGSDVYASMKDSIVKSVVDDVTRAVETMSFNLRLKTISNPFDR